MSSPSLNPSGGDARNNRCGEPTDSVGDESGGVLEKRDLIRLMRTYREAERRGLTALATHLQRACFSYASGQIRAMEARLTDALLSCGTSPFEIAAHVHIREVANRL
jgi:hypothetical protein